MPQSFVTHASTLRDSCLNHVCSTRGSVTLECLTHESVTHKWLIRVSVTRAYGVATIAYESAYGVATISRLVCERH